MQTLTTELARRLAASSWQTVNEVGGDEAVRALVNWLGCALAGCRETYVDAMADAAPSHARHGDAPVPGLGQRLDRASVAVLAAEGADALVYADTHPPTLLRPGVVVGAALLSLAEDLGASGAEFVHAYLLGTEIACRAALALGMTGEARAAASLCNTLGAAAACAKLMELDAERTAHALDMACSELEVAHAARTERRRSAQAGQAARSGMLAALHARGETIDPRSPRASALADLVTQPDAFLDGWGSEWHGSRLAYHAYPCALFLHPVVEACLQLERSHRLTGRRIGAVRIRMHPSRCAFDGGAAPVTSVAAKHSVQHAAAVALLDGEAGLAQFETAKLRNGRVKEMRTRIEVVADAALPATAAQVTIEQQNGTTLERLVRCAFGHPLRPLGDSELSDKFRGLAGETLATAQVERLLGLAWNVRSLPDMGGLIRTTVPEDVYEPAQLPGSPLIPR